MIFYKQNKPIIKILIISKEIFKRIVMIRSQKKETFLQEKKLFKSASCIESLTSQINNNNFLSSVKTKQIRKDKKIKNKNFKFYLSFLKNLKFKKFLKKQKSISKPPPFLFKLASNYNQSCYHQMQIFEKIMSQKQKQNLQTINFLPKIKLELNNELGFDLFHVILAFKKCQIGKYFNFQGSFGIDFTLPGFVCLNFNSRRLKDKINSEKKSLLFLERKEINSKRKNNKKFNFLAKRNHKQFDNINSPFNFHSENELEDMAPRKHSLFLDSVAPSENHQYLDPEFLLRSHNDENVNLKHDNVPSFKSECQKEIETLSSSNEDFIKDDLKIEEMLKLAKKVMILDLQNVSDAEFRRRVSELTF
jgi:hypothetical protein